jgi:hypothetical protein
MNYMFRMPKLGSALCCRAGAVAELLLMVAFASGATMMASSDRYASIVWAGLSALGIAIFTMGFE